MSRSKAALVAILGISLLLAVGPALSLRGAPGGKSKLMKQKLDCTQRVMEGITLEDFEMIALNAKTLQAMTKAEEWSQPGTEEYQAQLNIFKFANDELVRLAGEEDLDGASLAYVQLTLSCVNCHKHIRGKQR